PRRGQARRARVPALAIDVDQHGPGAGPDDRVGRARPAQVRAEHLAAGHADRRERQLERGRPRSAGHRVRATAALGQRPLERRDALALNEHPAREHRARGGDLFLPHPRPGQANHGAEDSARDIRRRIRATFVLPMVATATAPLLEAIRDAQRDRHRPQGVIAVGGMGSVEGVHDRLLERRVVLKRIHANLANDPTQASMFVREARVTGQLAHPSVVPVHDLGADPEGHLYYTMERVEGRTLEDWVQALPPGPLDRSVLFDLLEVVVRVCDALRYAHAAGILHCDVKPANVMVGEFGQVYLMDWGIARFAAEESLREPGTGE